MTTDLEESNTMKKKAKLTFGRECSKDAVGECFCQGACSEPLTLEEKATLLVEQARELGIPILDPPKQSTLDKLLSKASEVRSENHWQVGKNV